MFEKKQIIYSESLGVCRVDNIMNLSATKGGKATPYYCLKSVFDEEKVAYIPVENHQVVLRELFSIEEAKELAGSESAMKDANLKKAVDYVLSHSQEA